MRLKAIVPVKQKRSTVNSHSIARKTRSHYQDFIPGPHWGTSIPPTWLNPLPQVWLWAWVRHMYSFLL